jgi:hypothetical protein
MTDHVDPTTVRSGFYSFGSDITTKRPGGASPKLYWAALASRAVSVFSAFSSSCLPAHIGTKRLFDQPGQGTRPGTQRFYHNLLLADPEDRSREGREDHVGLLKLKMPANVVEDSDGAPDPT